MAKSFSIKIGADTKEFNKELRAADGQIRTTTRLGDSLAKTLDHKYDAKTAEQAQKQFQKALSDTQDKAEALRKQLQHMEKAGEIDSNQYRKLETDLAKTTLEAANLEKKLDNIKNLDIKRLADGFKDVGTAIEGAGKKLAPFSAAAGGMIAAAGAIAKKASDLGGDIDEMSERFEVSSDTIQRWNYLSIQSGVETNTFSKALIRMRGAIADIAAGTSNKSTDILQSLGISPEKYKNTEEMFDGIIAALRNVEDSTLQTAYANEIFGDKIANDMLPYIKIADETLAQYNSEFDAMSTLTAEQVYELDHLSDSFTRFTTSMQYAAAQMGAALAPIMERVLILVEEKLVPAIQKLADWFGDLSPAMQNTILVTLGAIAVLAPLLILIGKMSIGVGALIKILPIFKALLNGTATAAQRAGAAVGLLGGALMLSLNLIGNWKEMSTIIKILNSLTVAALVATAAVALFHTTWSLGIAIGAAAAGAVAAIAIIKSATDSIGVDAGIENIGTPATSGKGYSDAELQEVYNDIGYADPRQSVGGTSTSNSYTDNTSNDTFNIYIEANEYVNAEEVADIVSKRISTLARARG